MPNYNCHIIETITYDYECEAKDWNEAFNKACEFAGKDLLKLKDSGYDCNIDIEEI